MHNFLAMVKLETVFNASVTVVKSIDIKHPPLFIFNLSINTVKFTDAIKNAKVMAAKRVSVLPCISKIQFLSIKLISSFWLYVWNQT